jgi:endonuclease YncB( thermonuclease family)
MKRRTPKIPRIGVSILLPLLTFLVFPLPASAWEGRVVELRDSRTLVVEQAGKQRQVALYGLRTPDLSEPFGEEAHAYVVSLLQGQEISIQPIGSGSRGALVYLPGQEESVNARLLREGWAWVQEAFCEKAVLCGRLNAIQTQAERSKKGIWSRIPEDTPPWRWLREHE